MGSFVDFVQYFRTYSNLPGFGKIGMIWENVDATNGCKFFGGQEFGYAEIVYVRKYFYLFEIDWLASENIPLPLLYSL